jgi:peptidoglycan glycosyltransferase
LATPDVTAEQAAHFVDSVKDPEGFAPISPIATQYPFPPGSTFKVVTSAAAYNLKPSLINFNFPIQESIKFDDSPLVMTNDDGACGGTMAVMLPQSCDPGYGMLGEKLGVSTLTKEAELFGYSVFRAKKQTVPGIDLPGVASSSISALAPKSQAYLAYSAIGQYNDSATALQNAMVAAAIANGGVIMTPHLMEQIRDAQGNVITTYKPTVESTVATAAEASTIGKFMQAVANGTVPRATATGIFPQSWDLAVKTGTAQRQAPGVTEQTDDWMIGFTPAGPSQIAFAVILPYQSFSDTGALVAGPIVKEVVQAYLTETGGQ